MITLTDFAKHQTLKLHLLVCFKADMFVVTGLYYCLYYYFSYRKSEVRYSCFKIRFCYDLYHEKGHSFTCL